MNKLLAERWEASVNNIKGTLSGYWTLSETDRALIKEDVRAIVGRIAFLERKRTKLEPEPSEGETA